MATNKSMIEALKRMNELIRELNAWNEILNKHIKAQKNQNGQYWKNDRYEYDPKTGKCSRV